MSAYEDQIPHLPIESESLPLKKRRTLTAKTIPELQRREAETNSSDDDESKFQKYRELQLGQLQSIAFQALLKAFAAETSVNPNKRNLIVERLMKEWKITDEDCRFLEKVVESDILEEQGDDSPVSDMNTVREAQPLTRDLKDQMLPTSAEKQAKSMSSGVTTSSSWGGVSPQSLVGKYIQIRLSEEDAFDEFIIKEYDAEKDMHRFETANADDMEEDDPFSWMDIRHFPAQSIMWAGGKNPWEGNKALLRPSSAASDIPATNNIRRTLY